MAAMNMTAESFKEYVAGEKPVLVEFWAPWCVYCRRIGPAFDKIAEQAGDTLVVGKVDIDQAPELARSEQIEVVPTLTLYRQGKALGSIVAPDSKAKIEEFLRQYLEG